MVIITNTADYEITETQDTVANQNWLLQLKAL